MPVSAVMKQSILRLPVDIFEVDRPVLNTQFCKASNSRILLRKNLGANDDDLTGRFFRVFNCVAALDIMFISNS